MHKFSTQGIATIMMALQQGMLEKKDMTETFKNLEWFVNVEGELVCDNPPVVDFAMLSDDEFGEEE